MPKHQRAYCKLLTKLPGKTVRLLLGVHCVISRICVAMRREDYTGYHDYVIDCTLHLLRTRGHWHTIKYLLLEVGKGFLDVAIAVLVLDLTR